MKRMADSRRYHLREGRTLHTSAVRNAADIYSYLTRIDTKNVAEFVNNGTLLCCHQQHQEG